MDEMKTVEQLKRKYGTFQPGDKIIAKQRDATIKYYIYTSNIRKEIEQEGYVINTIGELVAKLYPIFTKKQNIYFFV